MRARTRYFSSMNKNLRNIEGLSYKLVEYSKTQQNISSVAYEEISNLLNRFQKNYNILKKIHFNNNKNTEILFATILDNLYISERNFRKIYFDGKPLLDDTELKEFAASFTPSSIKSYCVE